MSCEFRFIDFNYAFQDQTVITASTEDPSFPASNLKTKTRAKPWRTTSDSSQNVVFDILTTEAIDSFAIVFDPFVGNKLTSGAVVKIQANATNVWTSPSVDVTLTYDETYDAYTYFWTSNQSYRYWRLTIDDPTNPYGYVEISKVFLGKATQLTQVPEIGMEPKRNDRSKIFSTEYGHLYADTYPIEKSIVFNYAALTAADLSTLELLYDRVGNTEPFLLCIDSTEDLFDKDRFVYFGVFVGDLKAKHRFTQYFDTTLSVREVI